MDGSMDWTWILQWGLVLAIFVVGSSTAVWWLTHREAEAKQKKLQVAVRQQQEGLENRLREASRRLRETDRLNQQAQVDLGDLRLQLAESHGRHEELRYHFDNLEEQYQLLQVQLQTERDKLVELQYQTAGAQQNYEAQAERLRLLQVGYEELQRELQKTTALWRQADTVVAELQQELEGHTAVVTELRTENIILSEDAQTNQRQRQQLEAHIADLQQQTDMLWTQLVKAENAAQAVIAPPVVVPPPPTPAPQLAEPQHNIPQLLFEQRQTQEALRQAEQKLRAMAQLQAEKEALQDRLSELLIQLSEEQQAQAALQAELAQLQMGVGEETSS
jgi:DNA repair exonuclease SbcCD ATPase subunit